jgi:hypothetical protein
VEAIEVEQLSHHPKVKGSIRALPLAQEEKMVKKRFFKDKHSSLFVWNGEKSFVALPPDVNLIKLF